MCDLIIPLKIKTDKTKISFDHYPHSQYLCSLSLGDNNY